MKKEILRLKNADIDKVTHGRKKGAEENVKQKIVVPILRLLGFDLKDMDFEHAVRNKRADIALLIRGKPKVIVECKSAEQNLDRHARQALEYAWERQVNWVLLTNGLETRLYRSFMENVPEPGDRELLRVRLRELDSEFKSLAEWVSYRSLSTNRIERISEEKEEMQQRPPRKPS